MPIKEKKDLIQYRKDYYQKNKDRIREYHKQYMKKRKGEETEEIVPKKPKFYIKVEHDLVVSFD